MLWTGRGKRRWREWITRPNYQQDRERGTGWAPTGLNGQGPDVGGPDGSRTPRECPEGWTSVREGRTGCLGERVGVDD